MTDILPIDRDKLLEENVKMETIKEEAEEGENDTLEEETTPLKQEEVFEIPKKKKIVYKKEQAEQEAEQEEKPKKKKRQLSEKQLANLAKAREKSMARRKELKEARAMDEALKKDARRLKKEERLQKKEEADELILMKAKLTKEAEAKGHWDEDRIEKLMIKTLDTYMDKRKKEKSIPKTTIPAPQAYPHLPPQQQPINATYYNTQSQPYHNHKHIKQKSKAVNDTLTNLFGFGNNNY